jgi:PAS domain S-box-containing protein
MNYKKVRKSLKKLKLALDRLELLEPVLDETDAQPTNGQHAADASTEFMLTLQQLLQHVPNEMLPASSHRLDKQSSKVVRAQSVEAVVAPSSTEDFFREMRASESRMQTYMRDTMQEEIGKALKRLPAGKESKSGSSKLVTRDADDAVRKSEQRLRTIIDTTPLGICITNEDGIFEYVNDAYCRIYGYDPSELVGNHFTQIVAPDKKKFWTDLHDKYMLMTGEEIKGYSDIRTEWIVKHKSGGPITILADAARITGADGDKKKVTFVMNISEMAKLRENLRQSEMQLMQAEKMSSLGQMVAGVAHEVNTPLGYVRSNLQLLIDTQEELQSLITLYQSLHKEILHGSSNTVAKLLSQIEERAEKATLIGEAESLCENSLEGITRIQELVMSLKNFSRLDEASFKPTNVNENIDSTLKIANHILAEKQIEVLREYGKLPDVPAFPAQLNQVFLNLITNAAHAITHEDGKITFKTMKDGDTVVVKVSDNGVGIKPDHLEKIFEPFFTTKDVGKGTGLGLSIVYKIIDKHGGTIAVQSKVGKGSEFTVTLPIKREAVPADDADTSAFSDDEGGSPFSDDIEDTGDTPKSKSPSKKKFK